MEKKAIKELIYEAISTGLAFLIYTPLLLLAPIFISLIASILIFILAILFVLGLFTYPLRKFLKKIDFIGLWEETK